VVRAPGIAIVGCLVVAAAHPGIQRRLAAHEVTRRIEAANARIGAGAGGGLACARAARELDVALAAAVRAGATLASWASVGGCGAGASSGVGGGVKWIGRNTTGGLFHAQCQGSYVRQTDGYTYAVNSLVNRDLSEKWSFGANLPWLYKYWRDPFGFGFDLSNQGIGDVNVLLTRRLGPVNASSVTVSLGVPTGGHDASYKGSVLRQDKQMGHGRATGGLIVEHTIDNLWGPVVVGGTADYRGGTNQRGSYRAPAASLYAHAGYLLGPFVPAGGLSLNGFLANDRDQGRAQDTPLLTLAPSASLEWATDWVAVLAGVSVPFDRRGSLQPWLVSLGLALAPF
jgi:hypothetical protein